MIEFSKGYKRSFTDQKRESAKQRKVFLIALLAFAIYLLLTNFVFSMHSIENSSMNPGLNKGERFVFLSFRIFSYFPGVAVFDNLPVKRGTVALIELNENKSIPEDILSAVVRFFTAGQININKKGKRIFMKRVIALPGDEITIVNYVARVRPKDDPFTYTEYECADRIYYNNFPENDALWDETLPLSGSLETITLGDDEYFLLSDDRSNTNDSRIWGPIPAEQIIGKALFRYWPFTKFSKL
jgi:signal peptidase I